MAFVLCTLPARAEGWGRIPDRLIWDFATNTVESLQAYTAGISEWLRDPGNQQTDEATFYRGVLEFTKQQPETAGAEALLVWAPLIAREQPHRATQVVFSELLQRIAWLFPEAHETRLVSLINSDGLLFDAALGGYAPAQWLLAGRYSGNRTPASVPVDLNAALNWYYASGTNGLRLGRLAAIKILSEPADGIDLPEEERLQTMLTWAKSLDEEGVDLATFFIGHRQTMVATTRKEYLAALEWLEKAAKRGHPAALYFVGNFYFAGLAGTRDTGLALDRWADAAHRGYLPAHVMLGKCYYYGLGLTNGTPDPTVSARWLQAPAEAGDLEAQFYLGLLALADEKNESKAKAIFEKAAEQGYPEAQLYLAMLLERNAKNPGDFQRVFTLYSAASNAGLARAQYALANLLQSGVVGDQSRESEAVELYRRAARQGYPRAAVALGDAYALGSGVGQSVAEAMRWYVVADRGLAEEASERIAGFYERGVGGLPTNAIRGAEFRRRSVEHRSVYFRQNPFRGESQP